MPLPSFGKKKAPVETNTGPSNDEVREQRLDQIKQLAERFTYDLALLIAGHPVELESYVAAQPAARLRASLEPFLASGDAMRPNFGEYGELRIEGNLLAYDRPVQAYIEFDDQSVRETADGELVATGKRRMLLTLVIDPGCRGINEYTLQPVAHGS